MSLQSCKAPFETTFPRFCENGKSAHYIFTSTELVYNKKLDLNVITYLIKSLKRDFAAHFFTSFHLIRHEGAIIA